MKRNDLSRALVAFDRDSTIVAVVELSLKTWLVAGLLPGVLRRPLKKQPADPERLLALLHRWRDKAGHVVGRIAVAFESEDNAKQEVTCCKKALDNKSPTQGWAKPPDPAGACHRAGRRPEPVGGPDDRLRVPTVAASAWARRATGSRLWRAR
jgi:hypothetical protein